MPLADIHPAMWFETWGDPTDQPLLLISGLGMQITGWPQGFIDALIRAKFHVLGFDNRDVGLSEWCDHEGVPDMAGVLIGTAPAPYLIADMADDAARLMEHVGWDSAHVVGVSMGGMIAQEFAIRYPQLVRSLTSIMSTPHLLSAGMSTPEVVEGMLRPRGESLAAFFDEDLNASQRSVALETFLDEELAAWQLTAGSSYSPDVTWVREQAVSALHRAHHPAGVQRHLAAIIASPDRRDGLKNVTVPTLVLHGEDDPLVQIDGGEATHAAIAHSIFHRYPGLGHQIPEPLWDDMAARISAVAASVI